MNWPESIENAVYYYLEIQEENYCVYLLCPLQTEYFASFTPGVETNDSLNIVVEIGQGAMPQPGLLLINGSRYAYTAMQFKRNSDAPKMEINIHTYVDKGDLIIPNGTTILLEEYLDQSSPKYHADPSEQIAYNKPYVCVRKEELIIAGITNGLRFYPRVLIPTKEYRLATDGDILDPSSQVEESNSFGVVIPLINDSEVGESMIVNELEVNQSHYVETNLIDGAFELVLLHLPNDDILEDLKQSHELENSEGYESFLANARNVGTDLQYSTIGAEAITKKPKSKPADIIPASGLFIDKPVS